MVSKHLKVVDNWKSVKVHIITVNGATCNKRKCAYRVHKTVNWYEVVDNWKSQKVHIIMMSRVADNKHKRAYRVREVDNQQETCIRRAGQMSCPFYIRIICLGTRSYA